MTTKIYRIYGLDMAMEMLRPGAKWEISNRDIVQWDDPRPCPTWQEIDETMMKIKLFEDSIETIYLPEQLEKLTSHYQAQQQVNKIIEEQKAA